jgi:hypothetical protein
MTKLYRELSIYVRDTYTTDADIEEYMRIYFNKNKVLQHILSNIQGIDISVINNKLKSQFKMIEELINILNDIWVDEKTKRGFIKFILKKQKTSGIQSGGMLSFLRSNRVLPETNQVVPINMRAKTGRTQQIIKLYKSMLPRTSRVLPEQEIHLNVYRRAHTVNFQNILDYIFLLKSYIFEVDDKMKLRYENEYKHLYKEQPIQSKERKLLPMLLMTWNEDQFKYFNKKPIKKKSIIGKNIQPIPTFTKINLKNTEINRKKRQTITLKLGLEINIKFYIENDIKYIN